MWSTQFPGHNSIRCFKYGYPPIIILLPNNIILLRSPSDFFPSRMRNCCRNFSTNKILLLFHVDFSPQGMNFTHVLIIIFNDLLPVLLPIFWNPSILLHLQVWVSLFHHLFLQHICWYIINKTKTKKYRQIHTSFKHGISFADSIPANSQKFTLWYLWEVRYIFMSVCSRTSPYHTLTTIPTIMWSWSVSTAPPWLNIHSTSGGANGSPCGLQHTPT